jgi:hypothetical protein
MRHHRHSHGPQRIPVGTRFCDLGRTCAATRFNWRQTKARADLQTGRSLLASHPGWCACGLAACPPTSQKISVAHRAPGATSVQGHRGCAVALRFLFLWIVERHRVLGLRGSLLRSASLSGRASAHAAKFFPTYTLPVRPPVSSPTALATARLSKGGRGHKSYEGDNANRLPAVEAHWLTEFGLVPLELALCRPTFQRVGRRHHDLPCLRVPHR